jgi:hypothetical protein
MMRSEISLATPPIAAAMNRLALSTSSSRSRASMRPGPWAKPGTNPIIEPRTAAETI